MRFIVVGSLMSLMLSSCVSKSEQSSDQTESNLKAASSAQVRETGQEPNGSTAPILNSNKTDAPSPAPTVTSSAPSTLTSKEKNQSPEMLKIADLCEKSLSKFAGKTDKKLLRSACQKVEILSGCESVQGTPIYHFNKKGNAKEPANVLVFSLIHGDETPAGSVGRFWMERLEGIDPRNNWRVVPILNPDGVAVKTRTNANKVDVNRNFPTRDWTEKALPYWKKDSRSNPRRFPGNIAASEPETLCALKHLEDYKPDFVVSIHTPLNVLDYDGPKVKPPKFNYLPWRSLGHYPGSLGRYLWFERKVPVLTMELKEDLPASNEPWMQLQDVIGVLVSLEQMKKPDYDKAKK